MAGILEGMRVEILLDVLGLSEAEVGKLHDENVVASPSS